MLIVFIFLVVLSLNLCCIAICCCVFVYFSGPVLEKAVISKQKVRHSLKTPDETVTVSFIPRQTNVKQSFPVTHAKLLKEEDLSSPGESEEEQETAAGREISADLERIDLQNFDDFGEDLKGVVSGEGVRVGGGEGVRVGGGEGVSGGKVREEIGGDPVDEARQEVGDREEERRKTFEEVDASLAAVAIPPRKSVERAVSLGNVKPSAPPPLRKWDNVKDLKRVSEPGEKPTQLNSLFEEEDEEEEEESVERGSTPPHIQEFGSSAVYYKHPQRVAGGEGSEVRVLKRITQIEGENGAGVRGEGVRGSELEAVKTGSVSSKLKMFGGGRKVRRTKSDTTTEKMTEKSATEKSDTVVEPRQDAIAPLPDIDRRSLRRNSEEKLKMDGLPSLSPPQQRAHPHTSHPHQTPGSRMVSRSPPLGRLNEVDDTAEVGGVNPTPSPAQLRRRGSSGVYSPLMISAVAASDGRRKSENLDKKPQKDARFSQPTPQTHTPDDESSEVGVVEEKRRSLRDERARRQLFALSADGKVGSRESAYMGWGGGPQQGQLQQRWEKEAGERIKRRISGLLWTPRLTGPQVPLEFRGLLPREPGRLSVWRQKVR